MVVRLVWHNKVFNETAIGIKDALLLLGVEAEGSMVVDRDHVVYEDDGSGTLFIIIGFHRCADKLPSNFVAVQTEQPGSKWFSTEYFDRLSKALAVWDFSPRNVEYLSSSRGLGNVYYVPTRVPMATYVDVGVSKNTNTEFDIDVLFYGANHPRRKSVEESLKKKGLSVAFRYYNLFGEERDNLIERSKVVLNIHYWPESSLETHRIEYLCSKGKCVVSEFSKDPELDRLYSDSNSVRFCAYQDIAREAHRLCSPGSENERCTMEYNAYHASMKRQLNLETMASSLGL